MDNKTKLEKITATWLKKAFFNHLKNGSRISKLAYISFIKRIFTPNNEKGEIVGAGLKKFTRIYSLYRKRIERIEDSEKLDEIKAHFPDYNIVAAYKYAVLTGKFSLNKDDINEFERILVLLLPPKPKAPNEKVPPSS